MKINLLGLAAIILATVGWATEKAHGDFLLDSFTAGQTLNQIGIGSNSQITFDSGIFGGERVDGIVVRDMGGKESQGSFGFGGQFTLGQGEGDSIFGVLGYYNFKNADFTQNGFNNSFELGLTANNFGQSLDDILTVVVFGNGVKEAVNVSIPANGSLPQNLSIGFDQFSSIDFSNVQGVELQFDMANYRGAGFSLGSFGVTRSIASVPEPASAMLIAGLLGGLALRRRR